MQAVKGSPREVIKHAKDLNYEPEKTGMLVYYDCLQENHKRFEKLMTLLPDNILVGQNDELPGLQDSKLPFQIVDPVSTMKLPMTPMKTIYAHNIRISSMNEMERAFSLFLRDWKLFSSQLDPKQLDPLLQKNPAQKEENQVADIVERRLTVVPHNSWRAIGSSSFVSLNKELSGAIQSSGALKIVNFPIHPLIALIYKLEYRGKR